MAGDLLKVVIGAGTLSVSDYVTAGGAGSFTDVGLTGENGLSFGIETEDAKPDFQQYPGFPLSLPHTTTLKAKVQVHEMDFDKLAWALRQPAANLTGSAPNKTLLLGGGNERYHQIKIEAPSVKGSSGTKGTETWTFWKAVPRTISEIVFHKKNIRGYEIEFELLYDPSVTTADKFGKAVITGAA